MAGESPDRSKQRESSAEPTSGSAGPVPGSRPESAVPAQTDVPETRDPRLAMARESASPQGRSTESHGGVDTATRVLSRRELEAVRAQLAKADAVAGAGEAGEADAVARGAENGKAGGAVVQGAENGDAATEDRGVPAVDSEDASAEADGAGDGAAGRVAAEGAGAGGAGNSDAVAVASEGVSAGDGCAEAEADGAGGGEAGRGEGAEALSAQADVDSAGDSEAARAESARPGSADAEVDGAGDGEAGRVEAGSVQGAVDGAGSGSGASGKSGDADAPGDDRLKAAVAAWVASADTADEGAKAADARDEADGAGSDVAEDAAAASAADADADADGDADGKGADTAPKADSSVKAEAEGDTEASDEAPHAEPARASGAAETSATAKAAGEGTSASSNPAAAEDAAAGEATTADDAPADDTTAPDTRAGTEPGAEPADTPTGTEPADAPAGSEPGTERAGTPAGTEAADAPAGSAPGTERAGTPAGTEPADAPAATEPAQTPAATEPAEPTDAPAAADGEGAPQGPPAPGDESRTGGAGGNTKAEGEAEAVDQPTAVFKAVRPKRPHVDQPTTMLKAPKPEAPSERTSKFVALKPDIRQDTPKTPGAAPQAPAPDATAAIPQVGPERTTQQPLPPKPPLDLLAELTNTPPPPDTPVRTVIRRIKIWTPLVLLLAIIFAIAQAVRPLPTPTLALTAEESYAFDGNKAALPWPGEGQGWMDVNGIGTMGNFGKQTPVAIGSVAKAMTAYVVLKDHPLKPGADGEKIKVDALAEKEGGYDKDGESTLNTVKEGDEITLHDAIAAIMIPSANNIARLLARWDAGTEKAFIEKMNATAKELGMKNTTYTDASGLKETTVSTAEDQVKLGNELVRIPALMKITAMGQWIDPSGKKHYNYNYLVPYNGAIGIKTGTTTAAGGNLLFAARKEVGGETVTLVGAILGQHKSPIIQTVNDVSKTAMLAAQDELTSAKILKKGDVVGYVDDGLGGHTPVVLTEDVTAVGWAGFKVKLSFDADDVPHTAKAGTKVGTLTVGDGTSGAVKVPVALRTDLTEPGFAQKLTRIL